MPTIRKKKDPDFKVEIGLNKGEDWNENKLADMKAFIKRNASTRSPEQKLKNELLSIYYQMEEYLEKNDIARTLTLNDFINAYLKVLKLSFKKFAYSIDSTDGNLKKYLSGERKFNIDLAMKFGYFFHTTPDIWLKIQIKNDMRQLNKEKKQVNKYKKYSYTNVLETARAYA